MEDDLVARGIIFVYDLRFCGHAIVIIIRSPPAWINDTRPVGTFLLRAILGCF